MQTSIAMAQPRALQLRLDVKYPRKPSHEPFARGGLRVSRERFGGVGPRQLPIGYHDASGVGRRLVFPEHRIELRCELGTQHEDALFAVELRGPRIEVVAADE